MHWWCCCPSGKLGTWPGKLSLESEHSTDLQALPGVPPAGAAVGSAEWVHRLEGTTGQDLPLSHPRGVQGWEWAEDMLQGENPESWECLLMPV